MLSVFLSLPVCSMRLYNSLSFVVLSLPNDSTSLALNSKGAKETRVALKQVVYQTSVTCWIPYLELAVQLSLSIAAIVQSSLLQVCI